MIYVLILILIILYIIFYMIYIPKYRILVDKRETKQIFPKKIKYLETNTILERIGISKTTVVYRIKY